MLISDLKNDLILDALPIVEGIDPRDCLETAGYLQVGGLVAVPINGVARHISVSVDSEIIDEAGASLGTLCLTEKLSGVDPAGLTRWQYVAYLADVPADSAGSPHMFMHNYAIIDHTFWDHYKNKYFDSAPVWGLFSHGVISPPIQKIHDKIVARERIVVPTRFHIMAFSRYIQAANAFDRYLRLYHTIELIFDFAFMKGVQKLNDDMDGFAELQRKYGRSELDRLKSIISEFCEDWEIIAKKFELIVPFQSRAAKVFQEYGKDGNPLVQNWDTLMGCLVAQQTSKAELMSKKLWNNQSSFEFFVSNVAAYWIYRTRSSIAHSRVSEFLFEESDEIFILDFAEELLLEVVRQIFSSSRFASLLA